MNSILARGDRVEEGKLRVVQSMDCTPVFEALVERENAVGVCGVQRSEEQQKRSMAELNDKLIEKENRRAEEAAKRQRQQVDRRRDADSGNAKICAREMEKAMLDHPHEPDLDWYSGPGYFVDDVRGGALDKQGCIEARRLDAILP